MEYFKGRSGVKTVQQVVNDNNFQQQKLYPSKQSIKTKRREEKNSTIRAD